MDLEDTMILHGSSEAEPQNLIPPGTYKVEIEFHVVCLQSPYPMTSDFQLKLSYPPFGIPADSNVFCSVAKKSFRELPNCDRPRMMAGIQNGPLEIIAQLGPESVEALREPIMIESSHGVAEINFIDVFSAPILNNKRKLRNGADLISKSDGTTIGFLIYSIRVQETSTIGESSGVEQSEFGPKPSSLSKTANDPPPPIPLPGSPQQGIDLMDEQTGIASSEEDKSSSEEEDKSSSEEEDESSSEEEDESSSEEDDEGPPPSKRCKSLASFDLTLLQPHDRIEAEARLEKIKLIKEYQLQKLKHLKSCAKEIEKLEDQNIDIILAERNIGSRLNRLGPKDQANIQSQDSEDQRSTSIIEFLGRSANVVPSSPPADPQSSQ